MVQYTIGGTDGTERPATPPICPKCGSHRTQVIGTSDDASAVFIRCNSCGERSTVPASGAGGQDRSAADIRADLATLQTQGIPPGTDLLATDVRADLATMQLSGTARGPALDGDFVDPFPR